MRILVLEAPARDQHVRVDQRLDHRLVGVALLAFVVDDAFSREAGRGLGEGAVFVDGVRNGRIDTEKFYFFLVGHPDIEILATMPWGSVHKTSARIIGDVIAGQQRDQKVITLIF